MNIGFKFESADAFSKDSYLPFVLLFLALLTAYLPTFTFEYMFGDDYNEIYSGGSLKWILANTGRPLRYLITQFTALAFRSTPEILSLSSSVFLFRCVVFAGVVVLSMMFHFYFSRAGMPKYYAVVLSIILFTTPAFIIKSSYFIYAVQYIALLMVLVGFYFGFYLPVTKGISLKKGAAVAAICYALSLSIYQAMIFYVGALLILFMLFSKTTKASRYRVHLVSFGIQFGCAYLFYELTTMLALRFYGLEKVGRYGGGPGWLFSKLKLLFSPDFSINFAYWVYAEKYMVVWAIFVIVLALFMAICRVYQNRELLTLKEVVEKFVTMGGCLSFSFLSYLVQPRINYSQTGPAMCATLMIFIFAINQFWNLFIRRHIRLGNEFLKPALAFSVAVVCVISANATVSSIAFQGSLELAMIKAELAKQENKEITEIVQVVPYLRRWMIPELCADVPCQGEFAWKMTSLVDGAGSQLKFVRDLLCGDDENCTERPLKITRTLTPPAEVEADAVVVDMRPLYGMYKRLAELN